MELTTSSNLFDLTSQATNTTIGQSNIDNTIIYITLLISSIIMAFGAIVNVILCWLLVVLIRSGSLGSISSITLLIQSVIDFFTCLSSIEIVYDKLSWGPSDPFWLGGNAVHKICFALLI